MRLLKLVDAATVVNVATDEERINDSLVEKLKFGQDIKAEFLVIFFYAPCLPQPSA